MKPIVCVTEKEFYKAEQIFKNSPDFDCIPASLEEPILAQTITEKKAFAAVLGVDPFVDQLYSALPKGGVIARFGVGHDGVDKNKATQAGLFATNTPGVLDDSVAEHAIGLIVSLARQIPTHDANMKTRNWQPSSGFELKGKNLLVLGCGNIGRKVVRIASCGFGMNVIGYDVVKLNEQKLKTEYGFSHLSNTLNDNLPHADFVSVHIPSLDATHHFINQQFLTQMKPSSFLVNTARGPVVDENELYDAIKNQQIAGAALDVFEAEPFQPVDPNRDLRTLPQLILTPHVGSSTEEACQRMANRALENINACFHKNYQKLDLLNPQVLQNR